MDIIFTPIVLPAIAALIALCLPKRTAGLAGILALIATFFNLIVAFTLFGREMTFTAPWGGFGIDLSLRLYHFSGFIIMAAALFSTLVALYSTVFMKGKEHLNQYYGYLLLTVALLNGAVLANNLAVLLFFWEALLVPLFGMIVIGRKGAIKTAVKALIIAGVTDLCMMFGIALTYYLAGTLDMQRINVPLTALGSIAFVFMMIGAISKTGAMPFHSWIPDAAVDAPTPFMAFLPSALEKLLGIYLLARISLDLFQLQPGSWVSILMMSLGAVTLLFAVLMALVQNDIKKMLAYSTISQVGYMLLGIGTALPVGIVGGLFHMINHALYKSCLFLAGGSVEKQAGTTDMGKLGGIGVKMPVTFACFIVAALAISGVPPMNGFFSKELVYDAALERGWIFYGIAVLGSIFTAATLLKLGHAAFLGEKRPELACVKEAPIGMTLPMIVIAAICILFGVYNTLPLTTLIQPILGSRLEGHSFGGFHVNPFLVSMTVIALALAYASHRFGVKRTGSALGAAEHIRRAGGLATIFDRTEQGGLDPYDMGMALVNKLARIAYGCDRFIDWVYSSLTVNIVELFSRFARAFQNGSYAGYIGWSLAGFVVIVVYILRSI